MLYTMYIVHLLWINAIAVDIYYRQVYYIIQKYQGNVGIMSTFYYMINKYIPIQMVSKLMLIITHYWM